MLDRQGREEGVAREVAGGAERREQIAQHGGVASGGMDDRDGGLSQPAVDDVERLRRLPRTSDAPRIGRDPEEANQRQPGERDRLGARERRLDPVESPLMMGPRLN